MERFDPKYTDAHLWTIEAHEDEDYIRFITPDGFKFDYQNIDNILSTLSVLSDRNLEFQYTNHFERFYIEGDGRIVVISCDPWINEGFTCGYNVTNVIDFSKILVRYLSDRYANSIS